jgi:Zn ribbon nucleic-acid-binding protein
MKRPGVGARCPNCRARFRALEDEAGMHECPHCGFDPHDDLKPEEDEESETADVE